VSFNQKQEVVNTKLLGYINKNKKNIEKIDSRVDNMDKYIKTDKKGGFNHQMAMTFLAIKNGTYIEPIEEDDVDYSTLDIPHYDNGAKSTSKLSSGSDYYKDCSVMESYQGMFS